MATSQANPNDVREDVRRHYAASALAVMSTTGTGCGPCCEPADVGAEDAFSDSGAGFYGTAEREALPEAAVLASLGCGNPTAVAELRAKTRRCSTSAQAAVSMSLVGPSRGARRARLTGST